MRAAVLGALLVAMGLTGCVGQAGELAANSIGCVDASGAQSFPDVFQYGGAVSCKTTTETHTWENPNVQGFVQWSGASQRGTLDVRILDSVGRVVFEASAASLAVEGEQRSTEYGFPSYPTGPWTIELQFENFTGVMGLQVASTA